MLIDCIGLGNIWIDEDFDERTVRLAREVILKSLLGTDVGELEIIVFDYNLRGIEAPFASLHSDHLLKTLLSTQELSDYLEFLKQHIQSVKNVIQGREPNLLAFRDSIGKRVEGFKLIVITADMYSLDDRVKETLSIVLKAGPSAGVSFLIISPVDEETAFLHSKCRVIPSGEITPVVVAQSIIQSCENLSRQLARTTMDPVLFTDVENVGTMWGERSTDGVTFAIGKYGIDNVNITMGSNREQLHNALITGAVGQGKSNLISVIIHSLCQRYSPSELELYLLDFKEGVTLRNYSNIDHPEYLPHAKALGLQSDVEFGVAVLNHLYATYEKRMQLFKRSNVQNIKQYRESTGSVLPRIVVIIDEFQMLFEDKAIARQIVALLSKCTRLFRAAGIHFILASQTIASGIELGKDSDIFAQTPIRIAHRNSARESEATLGLGNVAAADLRMGEAIVNLDYGAIASNRKVVVAWADETMLADLRTSWWECARTSTKPPYVFDGTTIIDIVTDLPAMMASRGGSPLFAAGQEISVDGSSLRLEFGSESGRNVAVFGAGQENRTATDDESGNTAIGVLQNAAISLAFQNTKGNALFMLCDLTDDETRKRNNMDGFEQLLEELGFPCERLSREQFIIRIGELAEQLRDRSEDSDIIYMFGFGLEKINDMPKCFGRLVKDGPAKGVHVLAWWRKSSVFESHVGFGNAGYFDIKILLRLEEREAQHVLGPFIRWKARPNRALVSDSTYLSEPVHVIPYSSIDADGCERIKSALL
jgi:hypothetical protein